MSTLIKGMKMPRNCGECRLRWRSVITDMDTCKVLLKDIWKADLLTGRLEDCPLAPVPTPHGPLIDADEIIEVQMFDEMYDEWTLKTMSVAEYLAFAADTPPTVIEAEGGEPHEQN